MIRQLQENEVARIVPLYEAVQAQHAEVYPWRFRAAMDARALVGEVAGLIGDGHVCLVDEVDGVLRGFLLYEVQETDGTIQKHRERLGIIHVVSIAEDHRRKGVGVGLMKAALAAMADSGVPRWRASHWAFNEASHGLMRAMGAEVALLFLEGETREPEASV